MNGITKKQISKGYSIALIVLAAIFTIFSILPAVVIDTHKFRYADIYYTGRYTGSANKVNEINVGFGTVFNAVKHWDDISHVFSVQTLDDAIVAQTEIVANAELALADYVADYIENLALNSDLSDPATYEEYQKLLEKLHKGEPVNSTHQSYITAVDNAKLKLAENVAERDEKLASLTEEDKERLADKLQNDEGFLEVIGTVYAFMGYVADDVSDAFTGDNAIGTNPLPGFVSLIGIIVLIALIGVAIVYPIVVIIMFIVKLIQFLMHMKDEDDADAAEKRMEKFPFSGYAATITILFMLFALLASGGISMGAGVVGAIVVWVLSNALRTAKKIYFAKEDRLLIIVKQALTVVSVIAVAVLLVNFSGIDLIGHLDDSMESISRSYYDTRVEQLAESAASSGVSAMSIYETARDDVSGANTKNTLMVLAISVIGVCLIASTLINVIERFGYKGTKAMTAMAIVLLVIAILPATFGVKTLEERSDAYKEGKFKVCYSEFEIDGSAAQTKYELLKATHEKGVEVVADLKEEVKDADGELADKLKEELDDAEFELASLEDEIKDMEAQASRCTVCIVMAVIFVVAEFAYMFAPKFVPVGKKEEEAAEAEAPVEEAPAAVAEEAVAEEVVAEEVVAEEAPAEAVAEEAVVEEAPAEETKQDETVSE
ncbi:MAG: hypothetical protein IJV72_07845 [Clostridia bacterium]|nr:hypothetical protein [Clostridia bacterium]